MYLIRFIFQPNRIEEFFSHFFIFYVIKPLKTDHDVKDHACLLYDIIIVAKYVRYKV